MGSLMGPKIITENLVLYYDSQNPKSYPGSGNTIYDLSKSKINGSMNNVLFYNNFLFFVDGYIDFNNPINQENLLQEWSVISWINIDIKSHQCLIEGLNKGLFISYVQGENTLLYLNSGDDYYYTYGGNVSNIGWCQVTFRFKNETGERTIYRNLDNITTSGPNKTSTPSGISSILRLGKFSSYTVLGYISNLLIYDRYITNDELKQNYNSLKERHYSQPVIIEL